MLLVRRFNLYSVVSLAALWVAPALGAQTSPGPSLALRPEAVLAPQAACEFSDVPGAVWWGTESEMTMERFMSYIAPVYWLSPDEPLLNRTEGADIRIPEALPFETAPDAPVVYYQLEDIVTLVGAPEPPIVPDTANMNNSVIDLEWSGVMRISFFAYFSSEEGVGAHDHDVEATEFRIGVARTSGEYLPDELAARCDEETYVIMVFSVAAKAHGIRWFWNVLNPVDTETRFPMYLMVEEGKHGLATDKNSDGYFTPGYDVNRNINDAWGVRDIIRTGALFGGGYQAYMTKVRTPEYRVFPPLPDDSPLRASFDRRSGPVEERAVYELRPFPSASLAEDDPGLHHFMKDKEVPDWPRIEARSELSEFISWLDEGAVVKSFAIAFRADGDLGFSFVFPLFIVKNFEDPLTGGFLVWRMYLKDENLRDFGWMIMYTPSASRWIDTYFSTGVEWDTEPIPGGDGASETKAFFTLETGVKFRVQIGSSPIKFLTFLTDFWGLRFGVLNKGFFDIDELTYVIEIGAGAW